MSLGKAALILAAAAASAPVGVTPSANVLTVWMRTVVVPRMAVMSTNVPPKVPPPGPGIHCSGPLPAPPVTLKPKSTRSRARSVLSLRVEGPPHLPPLPVEYRRYKSELGVTVGRPVGIAPISSGLVRGVPLGRNAVGNISAMVGTKLPPGAMNPPPPGAALQPGGREDQPMPPPTQMGRGPVGIMVTPVELGRLVDVGPELPLGRIPPPVGPPGGNNPLGSLRLVGELLT